eukprot:gb/GECH01006877.1/.p1 GENE.gb/GECH01006877.1/~~gb/GECH01006877.1/.p1  ORF type:complete len:836 (+),score=228.02 gb/GECH01006877.1/:1-2508(+)
MSNDANTTPTDTTDVDNNNTNDNVLDNDTNNENMNNEPEIKKREGITPIFLTFETQEKFGLRPDTDVTVDYPWKLVSKSRVLEDISQHGVMSDFESCQDSIKQQPNEDIMVVYDKNAQYGESFFMCLGVEAFKEEIKKKFSKDDELEKKLQERKKWSSYGSEKEIDSMKYENNRQLIRMSLKRKAKDFEDTKLVKFTDSDPLDMVYLVSERNQQSDLQKMITDADTQAVIIQKNTVAQTPKFRKVNSSVQFNPEEMSNEYYKTQEQNSHQESEEQIQEFLHNVLPRIEFSLRQNLVFNVFEDDFALLEKEDSVVGAKSENVLKEHQSFTHVEYTKGRPLSSIDWKPKSNSVIAVSSYDPRPLEKKVNDYGKSNASYAAIWSFNDPINPQMVLKAPYDIMSINYNPTQQHYVIGGLSNGQVCLWDISRKEDKFTEMNLEGKELQKSSVPYLNPIRMSHVPNSHKKAVEDIHWLPMSQIIDNEIIETDDNLTYQFVSVSSESVLVWDIRERKSASRRPSSKKNEQHEQTVWSPIKKFSMMKLDNVSDAGAYQLCMVESLSEDVYTLHLTSQDGYLIIAEWLNPSNDSKSRNIVKQLLPAHFGPVLSIDRNCYLKDVLLTVGDWSFKVWKMSVDRPLLKSPFSKNRRTVGKWSPTRPGVLFIGTEGGEIEIWDLVDKSHEPMMTHNITSCSIISIEFRISKSRAKYRNQRMAVGDSEGILHIIDVPKNLIRPGATEGSLLSEFLSREEERVDYYKKRWEMHQKEYQRLKKERKLEKEKEEKEEREEGQPSQVDTIDQNLVEDESEKEEEIEEEFLKIIQQYDKERGETELDSESGTDF